MSSAKQSVYPENVEGYCDQENHKDESSAITDRMLNKGFMMIISAALRLILIAYGEWQDAHMEVHYTDVDYLVFSDAATLMAAGKSPYDRATYRYSPLLAVLLIPNAVLYPSWGKILFSAADLLVGHLIYHVLKLRGVPEKHTILCVAAWLFNPFTFTIGTRGNCEPIVCAIILWIVLCLMKGQIMQAALWYGLVVHFRIYPIIYSLTILIILEGHYNSLNQWGKKNKPPSPDGSSVYQKFKDTVKLELSFNFLNRERILFGLLSGGVFIILTSICYYFYGQIFLQEALLYHLTRTDPRHNFSIYFYYIYLHHDRDFSLLERLFAFLPQFMVQLVLILFFAKDFSFCIFAQTVAFVAFNKVITAQYFVWFFCLLPLILPWTRLHFKWKGLLCIVAWVAAQVHWLGWAYLLEFKGLNVLVPLWLASIIFLIANVFVLVILIANHNMLPFFKVEQNASVTVAKKSD